VRVSRLWLTDYRNYNAAEVSPAPNGLTVIQGANGEGKTNLLEAVGYLATLESFRGAPADALVRVGADRAIVRAESEHLQRESLIEAELARVGRDRVMVNRQRLRRARDLLGTLRVTVFSPDDLVLVKGGPGERRRYLDDALVAVHPKHDALRADLDRILRQRNTLLKQAAGRLVGDAVSSLDVWDHQLARCGTALAEARSELVVRLEPELAKAYGQLADATEIGAQYQPSWDGPLADALLGARTDDVRRGVTTVGPHRDELALAIAGLPARTHASQGEQRSLALALRLAVHRVVADTIDGAPVLLLDDVFSELDPHRSAALLEHLPSGQALLTTAGPIPDEARPEMVVHVEGGKVLDS
jgi:DNA replication and repair protein RecF